MKHRFATLKDAGVLALLNHQLIQDERHRNRLTPAGLEQRMRGWLVGGYRAVLFEQDGGTVAYALYRTEEDHIYLRQFFVSRAHRREGIGREAMRLLFHEVWPKHTRIVLEVLVNNRKARRFWKEVGFTEYAVTMERTPRARGSRA